MAISNRSPLPTGTVIRSDQGVQLMPWASTRRAKESGLVPPMWTIGDCYDKIFHNRRRRHTALGMLSPTEL